VADIDRAEDQLARAYLACDMAGVEAAIVHLNLVCRRYFATQPTNPPEQGRIAA
jgi:hypothetical protein